MAEKQDIPMNAFSSATNAEYIYGELADGSQVKIKKSDLLGNTLQIVTLWATNIDCNNIEANGVYVLSGTGIVNAPFIYGVLLHIGDSQHKLQLFSDSEGRYYIRSLWGSKWYNWKQI